MKKSPLAPESTIAECFLVYCFAPVRDWIKGGGLHLFFKNKADEVELLHSLNLSNILDPPRRHNQLFHPIGRLAAFSPYRSTNQEHDRPLYCNGAQSLRAGQSIVSGPGVLMLIALTFVHPNRELLVGFN